VVQKLASDARTTLRNRELVVRRGSDTEKFEIADPDQLLEVLRDRFALPFPAGTRFKAPAF